MHSHERLLVEFLMLNVAASRVGSSLSLLHYHNAPATETKAVITIAIRLRYDHDKTTTKKLTC